MVSAALGWKTMNVEITPEPDEEERAAILEALAQEEHTGPEPWAEEDSEP
jgi:hypothetical protein